MSNTPLALSVYKVKPPAEGDNMYLWVESNINGDTLIMGSMLYYKLYGIGIKSSDFTTEMNSDYHVFDPDTLTGISRVGIYQDLNGRPTGPAAIDIGLSSDQLTEGGENLYIQFFREMPTADYKGGEIHVGQFPGGASFRWSAYLGAIEDTSTGSTNIHRLRNILTGQYLFTGNQDEITGLIKPTHFGFPRSLAYYEGEVPVTERYESYHLADPQWWWLDEGIFSTSRGDADQIVSRFFNGRTGRHLYSANNYETELLISNSEESGYIYEGAAFKVYSAESNPDGLQPVYRFYDPTSDTHLYSSNSYEQSLLSQTHVNEGIAWYG